MQHVAHELFCMFAFYFKSSKIQVLGCFQHGVVLRYYQMKFNGILRYLND